MISVAMYVHVDIETILPHVTTAKIVPLQNKMDKALNYTLFVAAVVGSSCFAHGFSLVVLELLD